MSPTKEDIEEMLRFIDDKISVYKSELHPIKRE